MPAGGLLVCVSQTASAREGVFLGETHPEGRPVCPRDERVSVALGSALRRIRQHPGVLPNKETKQLGWSSSYTSTRQTVLRGRVLTPHVIWRAAPVVWGWTGGVPGWNCIAGAGVHMDGGAVEQRVLVRSEE